jgi:hypothetical protein
MESVFGLKSLARAPILYMKVSRVPAAEIEAIIANNIRERLGFPLDMTTKSSLKIMAAASRFVPTGPLARHNSQTSPGFSNRNRSAGIPAALRAISSASTGASMASSVN